MMYVQLTMTREVGRAASQSPNLPAPEICQIRTDDFVASSDMTNGSEVQLSIGVAVALLPSSCQCFCFPPASSNVLSCCLCFCPVFLLLPAMCSLAVTAPLLFPFCLQQCAPLLSVLLLSSCFQLPCCHCP